MAKSSRGGRRGATPITPPITTPPTPTRQRLTFQQAAGLSFSNMTDYEAQAIRDDVEDFYDPDVVSAIKQYISNTDAGNGFSKSQWLNYRLDNGLPLNTNEKFMDKYLQQGMHDLGKNTNLVRAAHSDILENLGIKNYDKFSETQLQQALVGAEWTSKAYYSASYDASKNPFITGAPSGGREVFLNIKAPSSTKVVFGAKAQAEIILNKGTNFQITGVHYDNAYATPRGSLRSMRRLIIDVIAT